MNSTATILLDSNRTIAPISPLLFGGFAEHMGRCIYEGVYEPGSPHADENGFRKDVLAALREINYRVMRYPGGNFVSGYHWLDGVGPKDKRPTRRELAWKSIETNQFGTNEFIEFCKAINTEPMLASNFGTGTLDEVSALVEYCNVKSGSYYSDLRVAHGYKEPHGVKYWCLGNEMDGPWQIGHLEAHEYGRKAHEAAKLMKWHDPSISLIACGSSSTWMPTYPEWDRVVMEHLWEDVDYLSMHYYVGNQGNDTTSYLASAAQFEEHVDTMAGVLAYVKAKKRSKHNVYLSWDEWNVWYKDRSGDGHWTEAPHLSEEVYNLEDALVVAQWLSVFLRRADILKAACVAQIVNVISPLHTNKSSVLKHSTFYPIKLFSNLAVGDSLQAQVMSPQHSTKLYGDMPLLDVSASQDKETGQGAVFIVNRSQKQSLTTEIVWQDLAPKTVKAIHQLSGKDPKAANSFKKPNQVVSQALPGMKVKGGKVQLSLPPLSFTAIETA